VDCFKYSLLIDRLGKIFDDMHVFLYEEFAQNSRAVLDRIEEVVGEKLDVRFDNKANVSLSSDDLEKTRQANILASCTENRPMKRILQLGMRLFSGARRDAVKEVSDLVGDYYSKDNEKVKSVLSHLNWNGFPGKYS